MKQTRSPINSIPLPNAGDSLWQRRSWILFDGVEWWMTMIIVTGVFTGWEWISWFWSLQPNPAAWSVIFVLICSIGGMRIARHLRHMRNVDLGFLGERYMAEKLDELKVLGYHVINDISCGRMNIDHVLVGSAGIFTIETKMVRKELDIQNKIEHTKKEVLFNGKPKWGNKALWQAKKERNYLREILGKSGCDIPRIQPIVVFPGWFVEDPCNEEVWVLNENYLVEKIRRLPQVLSAENVQKIRRTIEMYVRRKTAA